MSTALDCELARILRQQAYYGGDLLGIGGRNSTVWGQLEIDRPVG